MVEDPACVEFFKDLAHPLTLDGHPGQADDVEAFEGVEVDRLDVLVHQDDLVAFGREPGQHRERQDRACSTSCRAAASRG